MGAPLRLSCALAGLIVGLTGASQFVGWTFSAAPALGRPLPLNLGVPLYAPWALLGWKDLLARQAPAVWRAAAWITMLGALSGLGFALLVERPQSHTASDWGGLKQARRAGLRHRCGCILGELGGRVLATEDMRPSLVTGGTRSGKGRGHVTPTLLSWPQSVLVHDPKGELWPLTAGYRAKLSHALYFDPRSPTTARWNPLAEITPGDGELARIQRLVAILSDPGGVRSEEAIWDKAACEILEAVILHVLYCAPDEAKTLLTAREMLADLDASADLMLRTHHRPGPDGAPACHPFIATAVKGYGAMHDRFRTSVQGTARSYLKWLAGEDVERALAASDFAISDLMCATRPMSLYVQVAPADAVALRPLVRLVFHAATQALTSHPNRDSCGRTKAHRLLLVMDEFPLLGRLEFFEKSLRLMSGYGLKAMFVAQSLNDIVETYGPNNTILDNCHTFTAFSALDPLTQDKVSRLSGTALRPQVSRSGPPFPQAGRHSVSISHIERPLLTPGAVGALGEREQIIFTPGGKPIRARKLRYDKKAPFRARAALPPPDQGAGPDVPPRRPHPWQGRRALGQADEHSLAPFKEAKAAILDKQTAAKVAEAISQVAQDYAAQNAAIDHLRGMSRDES
ncbi:type IV secretion system protein VirD4 [Phenylobacterium haematophilum]|uniref:Type IV secretion system protein VirD4 n=1 Tax=Phenylobacterium haematophilum TaxID=98513 RepID=A0A840A552_9CAUL|nr:type IV secretory system conjugative DNA transfer family protein [Phenylobacterium haematophilum]MBB3893414.1 type IV secretion system protein VirD4 [Phenylobacterium haematophilum]